MSTISFFSTVQRASATLLLLGALACGLAPVAQGQNLALYLDGAGDGVSVPSTPALDVQSAYTIEAWVKWEGNTGNLLRKDGYDRLAYSFGASAAGIGAHHNWWHNNLAGTGCGASPGTAPSAWTHVAASFDGATIRFYRDAVLIQSCPFPQPWIAPNFPLNIGWDNSAYGGPNYFGGSLDELRIWNVARTEPEILQSINLSIDASMVGSFPGLAACWNFEGNVNDARGVSNGSSFGDATYVAAPDIPILDCNGNGVVDTVELAGGLATDCNSNGIVDACDIASGSSIDCNSNSIPDECENLIGTYCTAGTTVSGCVPSIRAEGVPSSVAGSGFDIVIDNVPAQRMGLIFYGQNAISQPQPWGLGSTSYLCIYYPVSRTGAHNSGGTAGTCGGQLRVDFNQFMATHPAALGSPFHAGQVLHAQGWFRDPGAAKQTNLSNGLRFTLCN